MAAFVPALLCTILVFMDQQITAVIINRKEHKLKVRGCGGDPSPPAPAGRGKLLLHALGEGVGLGNVGPHGRMTSWADDTAEGRGVWVSHLLEEQIHLKRC